MSVVLNTINPNEGLAIAVICAVVNLGSRNPFVVEFTSSTAEGWGVYPSTSVIAVFCPNDLIPVAKKKNDARIIEVILNDEKKAFGFIFRSFRFDFVPVFN